MMKLIKSELAYLAPWIIGSLLLVFVPAVIKYMQVIKWIERCELIGRPTGPLGSFQLITFLILASAVVSFILLYVQTSENRIRQISYLPVPVNRMGLAWILTPAILGIIYYLAVIMPAFILELSPLNREVSDVFIENIDWKAVGINGYIYLFCVWIMGLFVLRLFTERLGRWFLSGMFIIFVFGPAGIPYIFHAAGETFLGNISNFIYKYFFHLQMGIVSNLLLALVFAIIIQKSFVTRRQYLQ